MFAMELEYDREPSTRSTAAQKYERVIELQPDNVDALLNRGMIAYEQGDLESAGEFFQRAVQIEPSNAVALFNLGSTLEDLGRLNEPRLQLRLATRLDQDYDDANRIVAILCEKMNPDTEARDHWKLARRL